MKFVYANCVVLHTFAIFIQLSLKFSSVVVTKFNLQLLDMSVLLFRDLLQ